MQPHGAATTPATIPSKATSPHVGFYKNFGRPVAKVLCGAIFIYQGVYWCWLKLETEDIKAQKQKKIDDLEHNIRAIDKKRLTYKA